LAKFINNALSGKMEINRLYFDSFNKYSSRITAVKSGMSQITTAPAPILHHLPILN
jgi:hypothetical protein